MPLLRPGVIKEQVEYWKCLNFSSRLFQKFHTLRSACEYCKGRTFRRYYILRFSPWMLIHWNLISQTFVFVILLQCTAKMSAWYSISRKTVHSWNSQNKSHAKFKAFAVYMVVKGLHVYHNRMAYMTDIKLNDHECQMYPKIKESAKKYQTRCWANCSNANWEQTEQF